MRRPAQPEPRDGLAQTSILSQSRQKHRYETPTRIYTVYNTRPARAPPRSPSLAPTALLDQSRRERGLTISTACTTYSPSAQVARICVRRRRRVLDNRRSALGSGAHSGERQRARVFPRRSPALAGSTAGPAGALSTDGVSSRSARQHTPLGRARPSPRPAPGEACALSITGAAREGRAPELRQYAAGRTLDRTCQRAQDRGVACTYE